MTASNAIRELRNGDRMTRAEFHRRYERTPEDFRAELIGGIVYCAGRVTISHGSMTSTLCMLCGVYKSRTPGIEGALHTTVLLGELSEPEPDILLRLLPGSGSRSSTTRNGYVAGPPELLIEVAENDRSIDLYAKKDDYERYGVCEYLVACLAENRLRWFDFASGGERRIGKDRIFRSAAFPGLWIDQAALFADDGRRMLATLEQGLESQEHTDFVNRLRRSS